MEISLPLLHLPTHGPWDSFNAKATWYSQDHYTGEFVARMGIERGTRTHLLS